MQKLCPVCKQYECKFDATLGVLPCQRCQDKRSGKKLSSTIEFTSEQIKQDRKKYQKDILQPFRSGEISKEFIEQFGTKGITATKEEIKKAVNTTDSYYG